jgi:hypothetical protein
MVYIFLDVDGVLNNKKHYSKLHKKYGGKFFMWDMPFNPRSLKNLRRIIDATGGKEKTKIVLTSSWRGSETGMAVLKARLCEYGMKIYSITEYMDGKRGTEISCWLRENAKPSDLYIIIDDEMYDILDHFDSDRIVKINWYYGLTWSKAHEAIQKIYKNLKGE